ncbi:MAG: hypothetical protein NDI69_12005 [Bacteriovoracaceae bacterium]|nr:hypothetical protein [Bacteriovoracaceae bacterium]
MKIFFCVSLLFLSSVSMGQDIIQSSEAEVLRQKANEIRENALREVSAEKHKITMVREAVKLRQEQAENMRKRLKELQSQPNE